MGPEVQLRCSSPCLGSTPSALHSCPTTKRQEQEDREFNVIVNYEHGKLGPAWANDPVSKTKERKF